jgi:hypothetical protein
MTIADGYLYWADQDAIGRVALDGSNLDYRFIQLPRHSRPQDLARSAFRPAPAATGLAHVTSFGWENAGRALVKPISSEHVKATFRPPGLGASQGGS